MPAKDHAALKARLAIVISEIQVELRHLERSLATIDVETHKRALQALESGLNCMRPTLVDFFKSASNRHLTVRDKTPRETIPPINRSYARYR